MSGALDATARAVRAALDQDGPLARALPGFRPRAEQQAMAAAIVDTLGHRGVLVCEAGTGTGKTFAYLVPLLLAGLKTVVSTATKALQDQLFHRDLPLVRRALGVPAVLALLKGRQNYLCLHRLELAIGARDLGTRRLAQVAAIARWADGTESGDLEAQAAVESDRELRALVTSTTDNCLGQDCPRYERCFVVRARRAAVAADLVVVNHHLLFADMVLRETGFAELLPTAEAVVLDEAHRLPDTASDFFSRSLSGQQLALLGRDVLTAAAVEAADMPDLPAAVHALDAAQAGLRRQLGGVARRYDWAAVQEQPGVSPAIGELAAALAALVTVLDVAAARGAELERLGARAEALAARLEGFAASSDENRVRWLDSSARSFTLYDTPVSVASEFAARVSASGAAWIMTSATLAVDGRFDHFRGALGLVEADEAVWPSPFDFPRQSLLYLPEMGRDPGAPGFEQELVERALPVLAASDGRAFLLFTSYRSLDRCAALLREAGNGYTLLVQGEAPPAELLRRFRSSPRAVLLGTATFWEGVDVRGEDLSLVIIDKLPFGVPDDPVTKARAAALTAAGENAFMKLHVPAAVTALKQGAGRLIRDVDDRGVLMIADRRLRSRPYGRVFLDSLPPMPRTALLAEVEAFFAAVPGD